MQDHFHHPPFPLKSVATGAVYTDDGWMLDPPGEDAPSLLRVEYPRQQLQIGDPASGLFRYASWLPVRRSLSGSSAPVTFQSRGLAHALGLKNLWITFSGYWPEKGGLMETCSFKELEAYSVCGRWPFRGNEVLVVASAGNTARAFARVCSDHQIPLLLCVPEDNLDALWSARPYGDGVKLISTRSGSDYFDAIHLSNLAVATPGFIAEGGARNVARRDGMAATVLSAVTTIGRIPDYYFQAVGSGTGAIAAWEANLRFVADGRFGNQKMKLMVVQNEPFVPMYTAWQNGSRELPQMDEAVARALSGDIMARVLANRKPPYGIAGGLFDALSDTGGCVLKATNAEGKAAAALFLETEGIDIHPAAAIATAALIAQATDRRIPQDALIMLNITGGGEDRFHKQHHLHFLKPAHVFPVQARAGEVSSIIRELFA